MVVEVWREGGNKGKTLGVPVAEGGEIGKGGFIGKSQGKGRLRYEGRGRTERGREKRSVTQEPHERADRAIRGESREHSVAARTRTREENRICIGSITRFADEEDFPRHWRCPSPLPFQWGKQTKIRERPFRVSRSKGDVLKGDEGRR